MKRFSLFVLFLLAPVWVSAQQSRTTCQAVLTDLPSSSVTGEIATLNCLNNKVSGTGAILFNLNDFAQAQWGLWKDGFPLGLHLRFVSAWSPYFMEIFYDSNGIYQKAYTSNSLMQEALVNWSVPGGVSLEEWRAMSDRWRRASPRTATAFFNATGNSATPPNPQPTGNSRDDPKTTGRGARGG